MASSHHSIAAAQAVDRSAASSAARRRLLIVDDERRLTTTLRLLLADEHDVEIANSGLAARERLEGTAGFDAILCDLTMRDYSGIALYRWLCEAQPSTARRVIFMTGGAFNAEQREFIEAVPNPVVKKPFHVDEIQELVRQVANA